LCAADLGLGESPRPGAVANASGAAATLNLENNERDLIRRALEASAGNVNEAARLLGLSRSGLYRRLQKHGMS